jgi:predicted nucleic acid-binding protein
MRVVIDSNVFISAALKTESVPSRAVIEATRRHTLIKSIETEKDFSRRSNGRGWPILSRRPPTLRFNAPWQDAELVEITERIAVCRDPKDDKFLELAVNGRADVVVSGDADLLSLDPFRGIPIETPAAFLRRVGG